MIIWLASYPKSGNTFLRSLLASYFYSEDGEFEFEQLKKIEQFPVNENFEKIGINISDKFEVAKNYIKAQEEINKTKKISFWKTHSSFCKLYNKYNFSDLKNSLGVIYIVRDPRNVACSVKNHFSLENYDEVKNFLFREHNWLGVITDKKIKPLDNKIPTLISSWKTNYLSWKNKTKNYLLIKYENLLENPYLEFGKISKYLENHLNVKFDEKKIKKAIETCSFRNLQQLETDGKFKEQTVDKQNKSVKFFHLGPENDWKKNLDKNISREIENKFKAEMEELGYL